MEAWVFTNYELDHPEGCNSQDIFIAAISDSILEEEGFSEGMGEVQVERNGTVTNRFGDGTVGVPREVMDLAEDEETLYTAYEYEEAYTWRNVESDENGNFVSFVEDKIPGINAKKSWRPAPKPRPIKDKKSSKQDQIRELREYYKEYGYNDYEINDKILEYTNRLNSGNKSLDYVFRDDRGDLIQEEMDTYDEEKYPNYMTRLMKRWDWKHNPTGKGFSSKKASYNGYSNYPTWAVSLWIGNDEYLYRHYQELIGRYKEDGEVDLFNLADEMKDSFNENNPLIDESSVYSDLVNFALGEVNWDEIARNLVDDFE